MSEKKEPSHLTILYAAETDADIKEFEEKTQDQVMEEFQNLPVFWKSVIAMGALFAIRIAAGHMTYIDGRTGKVPDEDKWDEAGAVMVANMIEHTRDEWNKMVNGEYDDDDEQLAPSISTLEKMFGEPN